MKYLILATMLLSTSLLAMDEETWYEQGSFEPAKVEWLVKAEQECPWWHEFHSYDRKETK